jgi:hypothetical protein
MPTKQLKVPNHALDRYLDSVADPHKNSRNAGEIEKIIRNSYEKAEKPKRIDNRFHCLVEFNDPRTNESFGFYYMVLCNDPCGAIAAKTILPIEFSGYYSQSSRY